MYILTVGSPFHGKKRILDIDLETKTDEPSVSLKKLRKAATPGSTKKVWRKKPNGLFGWINERKSTKVNKEFDSIITNIFTFGGTSTIVQGGRKEQGVQLGNKKRIISAERDKPVDRLPDGGGSSKI